MVACCIPRKRVRWSAKSWYSWFCGMAGVTTMRTTKMAAATAQATHFFLLLSSMAPPRRRRRWRCLAGAGGDREDACAARRWPVGSGADRRLGRRGDLDLLPPSLGPWLARPRLCLALLTAHTPAAGRGPSFFFSSCLIFFFWLTLNLSNQVRDARVAYGGHELELVRVTFVMRVRDVLSLNRSRRNKK